MLILEKLSEKEQEVNFYSNLLEEKENGYPVDFYSKFTFNQIFTLQIT